MKAALLRAIGRPLSIEDVPRPTPGPGEVLVRVKTCGICRTDLHIQDGLAYVPQLPHVPGHEPAGVVVAVGERVDNLKPGQRVTPHLFLTCRHCVYCRSGRDAQCSHLGGVLGVTVPGGFAQFFKAPARNLVLAALGPKMLALSRDKTDGALPYNVTPEHTVEAKAILGPDRWLCVEQMVCLTGDAGTARAVAAKTLARYMVMPNYRNNWLRLGFTEDELDGRGSDRFLDAMVASGSAAAIRARVKAHFDAGATHVCIQPLNPDGSAAPDWKALEALAPGA